MAGLSAEERLDRLRLIRTPTVGPVAYGELLRHFGGAAAALDALPGLARRGGAKATPKIPGRAQVLREIAAVEALGGRLVLLGDGDYPPLLEQVEGGPPALSVLGHLHLVRRPAVALVGARNASAAGRRLARDIAEGLGSAGLVVVSGLARGIDGAAHEAALATGTIAVLAGGLDIAYPPEHQALQAQIGEAGLLVAELPVGTQIQARHFPRRNRIIAGLALGVVVVEAALQSGSLITARFALDQGREVMAVPGSPLDPRARGSNDLIRAGARLVEHADDVIDAIRPLIERPLEAPPPRHFAGTGSALADDAQVDRHRAAVIERLSPVPIAIDEVIRQCELTPSVVFTILLELELAGRLLRHAGGRVSLV